MTWEVMLYAYLGGFVLTAVVLYLAVHVGIRWQRELPREPIRESIEVLQQREEELRRELEELQAQLFEARDAITQGEQWRAWIDDNEARIEDLKRCEVELRDVEAKLAASLEEQARIEQINRELETKNAVLDERLKGKEDLAERIEELQQHRNEIQAKLAEAKAEYERLSRDITTAQAKLDEVEKEIAASATERSEIARKHSQLQAEVAQMETERDHLQRQVETLTQERIEVSPAESATAEERASALWTPVLRAADVPAAALASDVDELAAIERAAESIRRSGLMFSDRVIHAFHTALKVSRESPLLVLAGISGTGKSALPRRYAQAMNMHFLNVAVQPGWDSPMDLLGFYNHLEGRFKPTEIARALIQMDIFGGEGRWPAGHEDREELGDRMLLVLLDEMNLARIEYYFSEFLSKLEIRRDVVASDPADRKASEILLEIAGGRDERIQSIPMFVAENVLFVGTMNEDESTQTMSDKVIDRTNVMRFGRPRHLQASQEDQRDRPDHHLPYETWSSWVKRAPDLAEEDRDTADEWIERCNSLLDAIGRPFGHRTAQAIRQYLRQYPRLVDRPLETAMADQVEMRVLPRLRGIDPEQESAHGAIEELRRLVDHLGDDALGAGIDRALATGEAHLFQWQGIDRMQVDEPVG